jgi:TusA-related sulfurtransferase
MVKREEKIIARGLNSPGPLLMVKKRLREIELTGTLRIIVSSLEIAEEIVEFFKSNSTYFELDRAGDDYHVIVDLDSYKKV